MIIKNTSNKERNVKLLFKIKLSNNTYLVYQDINTLYKYSGKLVNKELISLDEEEFRLINYLIEKMGL